MVAKDRNNYGRQLQEATSGELAGREYRRGYADGWIEVVSAMQDLTHEDRVSCQAALDACWQHWYKALVDRQLAGCSWLIVPSGLPARQEQRRAAGDAESTDKGRGNTEVIEAAKKSHDGCRFRSQVEARWAVFFDTLAIPYRYEPEGHGSGGGVCNLPNFWLPEQKFWLDIKDREPSEDEKQKAGLLARWSEKNVVLLRGIPGWQIRSSPYETLCLPTYKMTMFVGDFPAAPEPDTEFFLRLDTLPEHLKQHSHLLSESPPDFDGSTDTMWKLIELDKEYFRKQYDREHYLWTQGPVLDEVCWYAEKGQCSVRSIHHHLSREPDDRIIAAYAAARQARLESCFRPVPARHCR
jgi:hypothetical protein